MNCDGSLKEVSAMRGPLSWGNLVPVDIGIRSPPDGVEVAPVSKGVCLLSSSLLLVSGVVSVVDSLGKPPSSMILQKYTYVF